MQFIGIMRVHFKEIKYPELLSIQTLEANKAFCGRIAGTRGT